MIAGTLWHVDPARCYYYEVHQGPTTVVDLYWIGAWRDNVSFELRTTKDQTLVTLVESSHSNIVLALYDASSGATCPQCGDSEDFGDVDQRGRTLLARPRESHPDANFVLSINASGSQVGKQ